MLNPSFVGIFSGLKVDLFSAIYGKKLEKRLKKLNNNQLEDMLLQIVVQNLNFKISNQKD